MGRLVVAAVLLVALASRARAQDVDPPEVVIGERLFLETRFAQFFLANSGGNVNQPLAAGDPVMDTTVTLTGTIAGPFAGQSMNCRQCHLVDEHQDAVGGGLRTYADFARHSPIPARADGLTETPRNSPALVNASLPRRGAFFLHFDGEFDSPEALVKGTFTGRNFGWLPGEGGQALAHIANVIRNDDGTGAIAQDTGGKSYAVLLAGTDPSIPTELRLPRKFRIDVARATDARILDAVARLVGAYVRGLVFARDEQGAYAASPYDVFLAKNGLPNRPRKRETPAAYSQRLKAAVDGLAAPQFVTGADGHFELHATPFAFGATELAGLKLFLGTANCVACHPAPDFTDFGFHDTGASQEEYDGIHGTGAFAALAIPNLAARRAAPQTFLPPSAKLPDGTGMFRSVPAPASPGRTDLGLWNVYENPALVSSQANRRIRSVLCKSLRAGGTKCTPDALLAATVGRFKTPGLRDLANSAPYLHTGGKDTVADVITFYVGVSDLARAGQLRNGDPEIANVHIQPADRSALGAFLDSLTEDYD